MSVVWWKLGATYQYDVKVLCVLYFFTVVLLQLHLPLNERCILSSLVTVITPFV